MDLHLAEDASAIGGGMRVTTSSSEKRDHVWDYARIPMADGEASGKVNEYITNVQIAELNARNAADAVIRWKKLWGYYADQRHEHFSSYSLGTNGLVNADFATGGGE
jgi:hypothetical protein